MWRHFASGAVRAVHVEHRPDGLALEVHVAVRYGASIPTVADTVAHQVSRSLHELAGIDCVRVTTRVVGVDRADPAE